MVAFEGSCNWIACCFFFSKAGVLLYFALCSVHPANLPLSQVMMVELMEKQFRNIKGSLFRKGKRCWGVEEACLLTQDTSYLSLFQMEQPTVIHILCQQGLNCVTTLMGGVGSQRGTGYLSVSYVLFLLYM